jgi:hypothetical protein
MLRLVELRGGDQFVRVSDCGARGRLVSAVRGLEGESARGCLPTSVRLPELVEPNRRSRSAAIGALRRVRFEGRSYAAGCRPATVRIEGFIAIILRARTERGARILRGVPVVVYVLCRLVIAWSQHWQATLPNPSAGKVDFEASDSRAVPRRARMSPACARAMRRLLTSRRGLWRSSDTRPRYARANLLNR